MSLKIPSFFAPQLRRLAVQTVAEACYARRILRVTTKLAQEPGWLVHEANQVGLSQDLWLLILVLNFPTYKEVVVA